MTSNDTLPQRPFTIAEAEAAGIPPSTLFRRARKGRYERVGPGLYADTRDAAYDVDLLAARMRTPQATICLTSALAHHGLVDAIPSRTDLALPRGRRLPAEPASIHWHSFDAETFDVGRGTTPIAGARHRIGLYSAERSIVDAFRLRSDEGYEIAIEALRTWLGRRGSQPARLMELAERIPRAQGPVRNALVHLA